MPQFWDTITGWFQRDREQLILRQIDSSHVSPQFTPTAMEAGKHYVRWRVAQMFLKDQTYWATQWYPAVHSLVRFDAGSQVIEIPNLADATRIGLQQSQQGDLVAKNLVLTPTLPFNGGVLSINTGLLAIAGQNNLKAVLTVLGDFAALVNVPQFSSVLKVAGPLTTGLQALCGGASNHLHLGMYQSFKAGELSSGYLVALRATEDDVKPQELWVADDELRRGPTLADSRPLTGFDYMLFKVDVFTDRDDYMQLEALRQPLRRAIDALKDLATEDQAPALLRLALVAAFDAPELTRADRRRVVDSLKAEFEEAKELVGISGLSSLSTPLGLGGRVRSIDTDEALERGEPTLSELLNAG